MVTDIATEAMRKCSIYDSVSQMMHPYSDNYIKNNNISLSVSSKKWEIITHQNSVGLKIQMLTVSSSDLSEWAPIIDKLPVKKGLDMQDYTVYVLYRSRANVRLKKTLANLANHWWFVKILPFNVSWHTGIHIKKANKQKFAKILFIKSFWWEICQRIPPPKICAIRW